MKSVALYSFFKHTKAKRNKDYRLFNQHRIINETKIDTNSFLKAIYIYVIVILFFE